MCMFVYALPKYDGIEMFTVRFLCTCLVVFTYKVFVIVYCIPAYIHMYVRLYMPININMYTWKRVSVYVNF